MGLVQMLVVLMEEVLDTVQLPLVWQVEMLGINPPLAVKFGGSYIIQSVHMDTQMSYAVYVHQIINAQAL